MSCRELLEVFGGTGLLVLGPGYVGIQGLVEMIIVFLYGIGILRVVSSCSVLDTSIALSVDLVMGRDLSKTHSVVVEKPLRLRYCVLCVREVGRRCICW